MASCTDIALSTPALGPFGSPDVVSATVATSWKKPRIWLLYEMCAHAPDWLGTPSLWLYFLIKTSSVQASLPRYNWPWYQNKSSRWCYPAYDQGRSSWPPCHLPRNERIITLLVIGLMLFYWYESARLPVGKAGILFTAQLMRNPLLLQVKVFVASS